MSTPDTGGAGGIRRRDVMLGIVRRLVHELGTGRATDNARQERRDLELVHARIDAIGRRLLTAPADPGSDTAAA